MPRAVREPIQVYLTPEERVELDRTAADLGLSRSEVLRRGILAIQARTRDPRYDGPLADMVHDGLVTAPKVGPGLPPPSKPAVPLSEILDGLAHDRADR